MNLRSFTDMGFATSAGQGWQGRSSGSSGDEAPLANITVRIQAFDNKPGYQERVSNACSEAVKALAGKRVKISNGTQNVTAANLDSIEIEQVGRSRQYQLVVYNRNPKGGKPVKAGSPIPITSKLTFAEDRNIATAKPSKGDTGRTLAIPESKLKLDSITRNSDGFTIDVSKTNASTVLNELSGYLGQALIIRTVIPKGPYTPASEKQTLIGKLGLPEAVISESNLTLRDESVRPSEVQGLDLGLVGATITIQKTTADQVLDMKTKEAEAKAQAARDLADQEVRELRASPVFCPSFPEVRDISDLTIDLNKRKWLGPGAPKVSIKTGMANFGERQVLGVSVRNQQLILHVADSPEIECGYNTVVFSQATQQQ